MNLRPGQVKKQRVPKRNRLPRCKYIANGVIITLVYVLIRGFKGTKLSKKLLQKGEPLILNLIPFADYNCCIYKKSVDGTNDDCRFPFQSWAKNLDCQNWSPACKQISRDKSMKRVDCHLRNHNVPFSCLVSNNFDSSAVADAVLLSHIGLSTDFVLNDSIMRHTLLFPEERTQHGRQIWGMQVMWESTVYYPAGASAEVLSYFDYTWGAGPNVTDFKLSYPPKWYRFRKEVNMTAKLNRAASINASSPVIMIVSNCASRSGREKFFSEFMSHFPVDSYGACFNNKRMGDLSFEQDRSNFNLYDSDDKIELMSAYKFQLVIENSVDTLYVTEKIFQSWEAGVVPLYLGAPEIEMFVPGANSFIDLRNVTARQAAQLVQELDRNESAYLAYHAWRTNISEEKHEPIGPLGDMFIKSEKTDALCAVCKLLHTSH